jgi:hypothetical protein
MPRAVVCSSRINSHLFHLFWVMLVGAGLATTFVIASSNHKNNISFSSLFPRPIMLSKTAGEEPVARRSTPPPPNNSNAAAAAAALVLTAGGGKRAPPFDPYAWCGLALAGP